MNLVFKNANRRRIGQHQRCRIFVHRLRERFHIDAAPLVRLEIDDLVAADGRSGGIRPVRRVGDDDVAPRIAPCCVIRARQQNAGELAMRACSRLQSDRLHSGDLEQALLQQPDNSQRTLRQFLRLIRMRLRNPLQPRYKFIYPRIVLHRAAAQRIHPQVDRVIPSREPREMANDLNLAQLRELCSFFARIFAQQILGIDLWNIEGRQPIRLLPRRRLLKAQPLVLRQVRGNFARRPHEFLFCRHL